MKEIRQAKLVELIKEEIITTQEDIKRRLNEMGYNVTQATVSRDMAELGIAKYPDENGISRYRISTGKSGEANTFNSILRQATLHIKRANNLIVIKTIPGMGSAAGAAVDAMEYDDVVGTLAGDDTLLIIVTDNERAAAITEKLTRAIG